MRQLAIICVGLGFGLALDGTSCRKVMDEQQARAIADSAVDQLWLNTRSGTSEAVRFRPDQFDDSGKVVDWFYVFESNTRPTHVVSILGDRHGGHEVHHGVDGQNGRAH